MFFEEQRTFCEMVLQMFFKKKKFFYGIVNLYSGVTSHPWRYQRRHGDGGNQSGTPAARHNHQMTSDYKSRWQTGRRGETSPEDWQPTEFSLPLYSLRIGSLKTPKDALQRTRKYRTGKARVTRLPEEDRRSKFGRSHHYFTIISVNKIPFGGGYILFLVRVVASPVT
ncbi:MAG: hypothetical protein ACRC7H_05305, partial [Plesiomonas shigelloides]